MAVTGLGVISSLGSEVEAFWRACLEGATRVEPVPAGWHDYSDLRSRVWSPLADWDRPTPLLRRLEAKHTDPTTRLALLVAEEALGQGGLESEPSSERRSARRLRGVEGERVGVFVGTGIGGIHTTLASASFVLLDRVKTGLAEVSERLAEGTESETAEELERIVERMRSPRVFDPFSVAMSMPNAAAAQLAIKLGLQGPNRTYACACASGTVAIGRAFHAIRAGECDLALALGVEYLADESGSCFRGFDSLGALAQADLPPERVNRPYDEERSGFLFAAGGAGCLLLERLDDARRRGAEVLAEVAGYGETCDAHNIMSMEPSGEQIRRAIELCLADAGWEASAVDYVNGHGTGTPTNDPVEARVLAALFPQRPRVNSTKSLLGHTLGASGALEAVVTVSSLRSQQSHPCRNLDEPIADLAFLRSSESFPIRRALSQSFAFGGQNAVVAFAEPGG